MNWISYIISIFHIYIYIHGCYSSWGKPMAFRLEDFPKPTVIPAIEPSISAGPRTAIISGTKAWRKTDGY